MTSFANIQYIVDGSEKIHNYDDIIKGWPPKYVCAVAENLLSTVAYVTHIRQTYMKLDWGGGVKVLNLL